MCGIFGIVSNQDKISIVKLQKVSQVIKHRGPDDEGYLLTNSNGTETNSYKGDISPPDLVLPHISCADINSDIALLHRRLSIIDLSVLGHQPMCYANETLWITLNGEIYNYLEIKAELIEKKYTFKSDTDTEVVLAAYKEWGEACVERFNGMWAFAILDRQNNTIFLSRDRLGIKPLYYFQNNEQFIFCSEIKGIIAYTEIPFKFNENKIREYLVKGQVIIGESEDTIFKGIKQLLPGHNIIYKDNVAKIIKYWELNIQTNRKSRSSNIQEFTELFFDSLRLMLRSDVEVGSCLSGGIDSSSIVSFASAEFKKEFNTFSAIWSGTRHDEYKYMKIVNEQFHCNSNYVTPDISDLKNYIENITWHQEIPIAGSSLIAQWSIMKKAREKNIPVLLDGQGADEILSGYPFYLQPYINELIYRVKPVQLFKVIQNSKHTGYGLEKILKLQVKKLLRMDRNREPNLPIRYDEQKKYHNNLAFQLSSQSNFLPNFLKEQIVKSNLPTLLHFEDRNSMAHSIEARVPYLDHRLVEFAVNIPSEQKIGNGFTKTILRDAMKNYVDNEILNRRDKIGFSTPIEDKLMNKDDELGKYMEDYLFGSDLWHSDYIDKDKYTRKHLFALYSLQIFFDKYKT